LTPASFLFTFLFLTMPATDLTHMRTVALDPRLVNCEPVPTENLIRFRDHSRVGLTLSPVTISRCNRS
jgi:hypothetical protein